MFRAKSKTRLEEPSAKSKTVKEVPPETRQFVLDEETKKALIKASSDSDQDAQDPTKFTLLNEAMHNRENADYYTERKDKNEVEQVNRLETWARLFPVVFGDTDGVKAIQKIVLEHVKDDMVNRASLKRKRESALVYAVKSDNGVAQTDKQIATFLGGKR